MYQCTVLYSVHCTKSKLMIFTFLLCAYNSTVYNIRTAIFLMRKETISEQLLPPLIVFFVVYFLYFCCWQRLASWCRVPWNWNTLKIFSIIYYFFYYFFFFIGRGLSGDVGHSGVSGRCGTATSTHNPDHTINNKVIQITPSKIR